CTAVAVLATAGVFFVRPDPSFTTLALSLVIVGTVGAELAMVFYNAMLPDLVPSRRLGRWSGWGWAAGYAGGLCCLVLFLFALVLDGAWISVPRDQALHLRIGFAGCALWFALFALPVFLFTPDRAGAGLPLAAAVRTGFGQLWHSLRNARQHTGVLRFLLARMLYTDALTTIFALGGIYAAATLNLDTTGVLVFGIAINVTAGLGAFALAWVDDWIGAKTTILLALVAVAVSIAVLLLTDSAPVFWTAALAMGLFLGPAQAASRSLMAHLAPPQLRGEMFGLFALAGKATAFLGPWCVGLLTAVSGSQRIGLSSVLVFLTLGGLILLRVPSASAADESSE
ncbi:MAG: MFS transporter, partial [Planctomycetota bacterium]|nr:MFS transporter [Planctomycetota bacterium]